MIDIKDNAYHLTTVSGEKLTFKLDMTTMLKLEKKIGSSIEATRIFLDLFKPGSDSFFEKGLTILCCCCVEKPHLTLEEFNSLFKLNQKTFDSIDEILHDLVVGYFGEDEEDAEKK